VTAEQPRRHANQGDLPPLARRLEQWRCVQCNALQMELWLAPGSVVRIACRTCNAALVREAA